MSSVLPRHQDPIVAIATAPGRAAVGIVRVSGLGLASLVQAVCGMALEPRRATYLPLRAADGAPIDHVLALYFPAPHSYTGEDVLELQAHGGPLVLQLLLARCLEVAAEVDAGTGQPRLRGLRLAQPGEYTERAFLNDKIDLAQAEAIADLIDASTEAAARSAARSLAGEFSREIATLREGLIRLRMLVEATLDFPEEELDFLQQADAQGQLEGLQAQVRKVEQKTRQGALLREGIKVVIAGQPNVGKSSLLNALAGAELAIVTPIAGTTRDVVQQALQIEGVPLHVIDTAGLRAGACLDEVERIGIERAWSQIEAADAVLFLRDLTRAGAPDYDAADQEIAAWLAARLSSSVTVIEVWNKVDVSTAAVSAPAPSMPSRLAAQERLLLSAKTGVGLDALRRQLLHLAGWQGGVEGLYIARARHVQALHNVSAHLQRASGHMAANAHMLELLAEELRLAQNALNDITGAFSADDLLGAIFASFCIGK